jgi:glycosyltransferase involved in cell wall biosynthesis
MISIVIPVLDEAASLDELRAGIAQIAEQRRLEIEILFVDDGSRDGTWAKIRELSSGDPRVKGVRLRRSFGKGAALAAGVARARGDIVCTMDGDGQDLPSELPKLLAKIDDGFDLVNGWRKSRRDGLHKTTASRVFNALANRLSGMKLHDHNCGLKCMRKEVLRDVRIYGELYRFIPILADELGFHVTEVEVEHRERRHGRSKFGSSRLLRGFLDLLMIRYLTGYRSRPQHVLGGVGLISFVVSLAIMSYLAGTWIFQFWYPESYTPLTRRPLTIYAVAGLIFGAQMMSLGFLAGLLPFYHSKDDAMYSVAEEL